MTGKRFRQPERADMDTRDFWKGVTSVFSGGFTLARNRSGTFETNDIRYAPNALTIDRIRLSHDRIRISRTRPRALCAGIERTPRREAR